MKSKIVIGLLFLWLATVFLFSCEKIMPGLPEDAGVLAGPVPDMSPAQLASHVAGDEAFGRIHQPSDGLGPIFVAPSCESCHGGDGKGHPSTTLVRFGKYENGIWDPLREMGGPQLQHLAIAGYTREEVPSAATASTKLVAPAVTGLGFIEAVEDQTILSFADPADSDGDGISGRPHYILPPDYFIPLPHHVSSGGMYIGRFGKKAGAINLLQQTADAYVNDIGITSDFNMQDLFNAQLGINTGDNVPDPEVSASTVHNVAFYLRTLKAPPRRNLDDPSVRDGEILFATSGCAKCHVPSMMTGHSDISVLSRKHIHPYSDFLLHDMGPELDDSYTEGNALSAEWKTPPLWGIGLAEDSQGGAGYYLHDGRARSLEEAILLHGGEGEKSREAFRNLSQHEKDKLISFLRSL